MKNVISDICYSVIILCTSILDRIDKRDYRQVEIKGSSWAWMRVEDMPKRCKPKRQHLHPEKDAPLEDQCFVNIYPRELVSLDHGTRHYKPKHMKS